VRQNGITRISIDLQHHFHNVASVNAQFAPDVAMNVQSVGAATTRRERTFQAQPVDLSNNGDMLLTPAHQRAQRLGNMARHIYASHDPLLVNTC
jgi:hypothetical protein